MNYNYNKWYCDNYNIFNLFITVSQFIYIFPINIPTRIMHLKYIHTNVNYVHNGKSTRYNNYRNGKHPSRDVTCVTICSLCACYLLLLLFCKYV